VAFDFDNDGWPDIYVANDSTSSALYKNNHDGTFQDIAIEAGVAYSADGKPQAGMGVSVADYDCDGNFDLVKTNFAGDTTSLYRNLGGGVFEDQTFQAGLGKITRFLGWGIAFIDYDNDGWPDIVQCNGHVYPEVGETLTESGYRQRKLVYRNLRNGRFQEVSEQMGPGILEKVTGRGMAVGDFDNDGDLDLLVNCVNEVPQLLRCDSSLENHWIKVKTVGTKSNRTGIGTRIYCTTQQDGKGRRQMDEVRSGGSYISQSDLRVHFGLGQAATADLEVRWPSGLVDRLPGVAADRVVTVVEGRGERK
jgi:hypothetical protein